MQVASLNVNQKSGSETQIHTQLVSTDHAELNHSKDYKSPTVEIGLLSCFVGSFLLAITFFVQYRKYRTRVHQQRILMLERLWKLNPQKQL